MRLHQQFDLNLEALNIKRAIRMNEVPFLVEQLAKRMVEYGYDVAKSSAVFMGIPGSIIVVKEFKGPFATRFSEKIKEDFIRISNNLGISNLFE